MVPPQSPTERGRQHPLEKLNSRDVRVLLLWLLAGLAGAGIAYRYFFRAFPEASVDFKVTRAAALDEARAFVESQGTPLGGYQSSIVFNVDDDQKTYLEREVGLEQANRLMSSAVSVWYWDVRFFKPLQKEEFRVRVDPGGRIVGYAHEIAEAVPGARLERTEALARAQAFLRDTLHTPLDAYTYLPEEANSIARPARTDWSFTWERSGFRAKDAPYRLNVTLEGGSAGGYIEFLKVPEAWQRSFARLRSSNDFIEIIAIIPYALLVGAALSVLLGLGRRGMAPWGWGLKLGLFITGLYFVMSMNQWPQLRAGYDTNGPYSSFFVLQIASALATSVLSALLVVIAVVPGEPLYRMGQPDRLRLGSAFTLPGLRTKEFFRSTFIGFCLAGVHICYVVLFYVVGRRAGVWAPQDLQYSDTLSTALPWVFPLTIGIYAATSEEFLFRMFSIRFLQRVTKSRFLAVVLPAFAWGFLHSNYPQEPPYIRGIEVGLMGIVAGVVMLRWGILATLTWHYTVDALLTSLSLMRSGDLYSRVSGTIVGFGALIPIGIAGVMYLARGGFDDGTALLNSAEPLVAPPAATAAEAPTASAVATSSYLPLTKRTLIGLALCAVAGLALAWAVKPQEIGGFVKFSVDAREAEARGDDVLRQRNVDPGQYRRAAIIQYRFDPQANEYLRRSIGVEGVNRIYREQVPSAFWVVRYFRDSQKEEYLVVLLPDGGLHSVHHTLAEAAPGAILSKEDALARAATFLHEAQGLDLSQWKLVEAQSDKLPARTDHSFLWEQTAALNPTAAGAEGAHERVELKVQGDEISGYRIFIHLPEEWTRKQDQSTLLGTAQTVGLSVLIAAFGISVLVIFLRNLKHTEITTVPWRRLAMWSLVVLFAGLAMFAAAAPQQLFTYPTDQPFQTFVSTRVIQLSLSATLLYSLVFFLFGLSWFFFARADATGGTAGTEQLPDWRRVPPLFYRDAFVVALCGCAILAGIHRLPDLLEWLWPVARHEFPASVPGGLDANWPAVGTLAGAMTHSFLVIGLLVLMLGFASCYLRRTWMQVALLIVFTVLSVPQWGSAGDFVQNVAIGCVEFAVIWWGAQRIVRFNLLGYLLVAMLLSLAPAAMELLGQPNPFFRANGWALTAVVAGLLLWPLVAWQREARAPAGGRPENSLT